MPDADTTIALLPFYQWDTTPAPMPEAEVNVGLPLDSLFRPHDVAEPVYRQSMFVPSAIAPEHHQLLPRTNTAQPAWVFVLLMALVALVYLYYRIRKIKPAQLPQAIVDHRAMDRMVRDNNLVPIRLMSIGIFTMAVLATVLHQEAMADTGFGGWALLTVVLSAAYMLRLGLIRLLGNIFDRQEAVSTYITSNYLYHLALTTLALPLLPLFIYLPWGNDVVFYILSGLAALCFLARLIRGLQVFLTFSKGSSFYLFYYLCIVEIAPLVILAKWFFAQ